MNSFKTAVLLIFTGSLFIADVTSVCCPQIEKILFYPKNNTFCNKIPGAYHYRYGICAYQSCADLKDHQNNFFCGKGDCNSFGCNCHGGCIQLDEWSKTEVSLLENKTTVYLKDMFLKKYSKFVKSLFVVPGHEISSLKLSTRVQIELENSPFLERLKKKFGI